MRPPSLDSAPTDTSAPPMDVLPLLLHTDSMCLLSYDWRRGRRTAAPRARERSRLDVKKEEKVAGLVFLEKTLGD